MPDWLKFLGKMVVEETRNAPNTVRGCFIALSGANGNVIGQYQDLRQSRTDITLVTSDDLIDLVMQVHPLVGLQEIGSRIAQLSSRQFQTIQIAYYEQRVYWIVVFENETYTLLNANGSSLTDDQIDKLRPMVEEVVVANRYCDLSEEAKARLFTRW
jgi:hypothetical protein